MKEIENKLPESIVNEKERNRIESQLRLDLEAAQESYEVLKSDENLGEVPHAQCCTEAWLNAICESGKKAVGEAKFLTVEQRKAFKAQWNNIHKRMQPHVSRIQNFIASIPQSQYVFDEEKETFYCRDITELATKKATHIVPTEAVEHWEKIQGVLSAVDDLRKWEFEHDVVKIPLTDLLKIKQNRFCEAWVSGVIKRDHSMDNKPYMQNAIITQRKIEQRYL